MSPSKLQQMVQQQIEPFFIPNRSQEPRESGIDDFWFDGPKISVGARCAMALRAQGHEVEGRRRIEAGLTHAQQTLPLCLTGMRCLNSTAELNAPRCKSPMPQSRIRELGAYGKVGHEQQTAS